MHTDRQKSNIFNREKEEGGREEEEKNHNAREKIDMPFKKCFLGYYRQ